MSVNRPVILNLSGEPIGTGRRDTIGSDLRVHTVNGALRPVQIVQRKGRQSVRRAAGGSDTEHPGTI